MTDLAARLRDLAGGMNPMRSDPQVIAGLREAADALDAAEVRVKALEEAVREEHDAEHGTYPSGDGMGPWRCGVALCVVAALTVAEAATTRPSTSGSGSLALTGGGLAGPQAGDSGEQEVKGV